MNRGDQAPCNRAFTAARVEKLGLDGIVTVLNTPFDHCGCVDLDALAAHAGYALNAGVSGFLYPAIASEVSALSTDQRIAAVTALVHAVSGRVPIIGGAWGHSLDECVEWAERLPAIGCDGVLVNINYNSDSQYESDILRIAERCQAWLMIQDWDPVGEGLPLPLVERLYHRVPAFRSLKIETVPAGPKYTEIRERLRGQLHVAGGWAVSQMIDGLDRGVDAFMPTGLHHTYVRIHRFFRAGNRGEAAALFRRLLPILAFSNQHLDVSLHFFKRLLHAQGIYPTVAVRVPTKPFDPFLVRAAEQLIEEAIALEAACAAATAADPVLSRADHSAILPP